MSEQWLSIVEYARQFNMSDMTVRRRIKTGRIQAVLREGKYYIPASEVHRKSTVHQQAPTRPLPPVVKPRPVSHFQAPEPQMPSFPAQAPTFQPAPVVEPMRKSSSYDAHAFLAYCEASLKRITESENRLESFYKEAMARQQAEISARDTMIKNLQQQVEDLQLLTKILEKKIKN